MRNSVRAMRLAAAGAALSVLTACAASNEVKEAVEQRQAAEAARPAAGPAFPAPDGGSTDIDTGAASADAPGTAADAPSTDTSTAAAPAPGTPAKGGDKAAAAKPGATGTTATAKGGDKAPAAAAAKAAGGCQPGTPSGGATDTGVSATTIKIGGTFFNGGFLDKYGQVSENAPRAYFNYINDNGGICGRKIVYSTCDTAGTADGTSGCLNKLANQEKVFIMGPSLDFNLDIVPPTLARLKLPWVGSSGLYAEEFTSPWMFPSQLRGVQVGALITQYSVRELKLKRMGVSLLNDVAGPECTEQAKKTAAANGAEVVEVAPNGTIETSLDNQVAKLRNAKVDGVLFCNDPVNTVKFIQAAQRVGWKPTFVGGFVAADDVPKAAGNNAKNMYGFTFWDFYKESTPGVKKYRQITEYYYPQTFHHFYEQATYVGAAAIVEALKAAGPKLTRESFLAELKKMTDFDTGLGLRLDFSDLGKSSASGLMLQADDTLSWKVVTKRFGIAGKGSGDVQSAPAAFSAAALPAGASNRTRDGRVRKARRIG